MNGESNSAVFLMFGIPAQRIGNLNLRIVPLTRRFYYSGENGDFIDVALREGGIVVSINLGSGVFETDVHPQRGTVRFDDNEWHKLVITREAREVSNPISKRCSASLLY